MKRVETSHANASTHTRSVAPRSVLLPPSAIPNAHITMAHFSSEPLLKPKGSLTDLHRRDGEHNH